MPIVTAGTIMNQAAALMNDAARSIYTYPFQIPYLNQALQELQELFELNNIPVTDTVTSDAITVPADVDHIAFPPDPVVPNTPYLPEDLIEPKVFWVSSFGQENEFVRIGRLDFLPRNQQGIEINQITSYVWQSQELRFLPSNAINYVKLDYIRSLFTTFTDEEDEVAVINCISFLEYRLAGLLARFMAENPTRADSLDNDASIALDRAIGIGSKGRQAINTRHRPFRAAYKRRIFG